MKRLASTLLLACLSLVGCNDTTNVENVLKVAEQGITKPENTNHSSVETSPIKQSSDNDLVLARLPGGPLTQSQLDQTIALRIYDLEWSKYELRRQALGGLIEASLRESASVGSEPQSVEVLIEPPIPPRLTLPDSASQPSVGRASAPVQISVFCNYQSSHCARMLSVYEALLGLYQGQIKLTFFDLPLAYHRQATPAAQAARCANTLGQFWPYHMGLFAQYDQLTSALYSRLAKQLGIGEDQFEQCMNSGEHKADIEGNRQLASRLDLDKVPITLINGLYLGGPKSVDTLRFFVDFELNRLGLVAPFLAEKEQAKKAITVDEMTSTALPLRLEGVLLGEPMSSSIATIFDISNSDSNRYGVGDEVLPSVFLAQVYQDFVVLNNAGAMELLRLTAGSDIADEKSEHLAISDSSHAPSAPAEQVSRSLAEPDEVPAGLEYTYRGVVDAVGETPLSKTWLDEQLNNTEQLQSHFSPTELEVEGVRVLRLDDVEENEFYQTLGLQEKDVILRVNKEWVHEAQNNLFEQLDSQQEVSIVLMRKGLPVHLKYSIN